MTKGGRPAWGLGMRLTTTHHKNKPFVKHKHKLGLILWINDLSDGIRTQNLGLGMLEVCIGQVH
jgi:hypothetical protein